MRKVGRLLFLYTNKHVSPPSLEPGFPSGVLFYSFSNPDSEAERGESSYRKLNLKPHLTPKKQNKMTLGSIPRQSFIGTVPCGLYRRWKWKSNMRHLRNTGMNKSHLARLLKCQIPEIISNWMKRSVCAYPLPAVQNSGCRFHNAPPPDFLDLGLDWLRTDWRGRAVSYNNHSFDYTFCALAPICACKAAVYNLIGETYKLPSNSSKKSVWPMSRFGPQ